MTTTIEKHEVIYALEGHKKPFSIDVAPTATAGEILEEIRARHERADLNVLLREDDETPVAADAPLAADLAASFGLVHVSAGSRIDVTLKYEVRSISRDFVPGTTIRSIITWAISAEGFELIGDPAEFQIKVAGQPVPPSMHLGQLSRPGTAVDGILVHNIKPQG